MKRTRLLAAALLVLVAALAAAAVRAGGDPSRPSIPEPMITVSVLFEGGHYERFTLELPIEEPDFTGSERAQIRQHTRRAMEATLRLMYTDRLLRAHRQDVVLRD